MYREFLSHYFVSSLCTLKLKNNLKNQKKNFFSKKPRLFHHCGGRCRFVRLAIAKYNSVVWTTMQLAHQLLPAAYLIFLHVACKTQIYATSTLLILVCMPPPPTVGGDRRYVGRSSVRPLELFHVTRYFCTWGKQFQ